MGCISSKVISRSISFRDELNKRQQIFGSNKGGDQFLALICTSDKLQDGSTNLDPNAASYSDPNRRKDIDIEVKTLIAEEVWLSAAARLSLKDLEPGRIDPPKRSKSWHQFPNDEISSSPSGRSPSNNEFEWKNIGVPRSQSFHTVEEFDALLERVCLTSILNGGDEDRPGSISKEETDKTETSNEASAKENTASEAEAVAEASSSLDEIPNTRENAAGEKCEGRNGLKRRSLARGLESLKIPAAIEFPTVGSLREWLQGGREVDSPGTYVTPKFGSYSTSCSKDKSSDSSSSRGCIFNPEIVTAIEEHMQQLQAEEETILKQIEQNWEDHGVEKDQVEEEFETQVEKRGVD